MKTLNITVPEQYGMLYESIMSRRQGYTMQQSRIVSKILDKFEAVGKVAETIGGIDLYEADGLPRQIELEDAEFELTCMVFREVSWFGKNVRKAVAVDSWLSEIERG